MRWRVARLVTRGGVPKAGPRHEGVWRPTAGAGAVRREVRRYLQMRMAMLVNTEVTESQVEMARTELSLLVDCPIFTLFGST